MFKLHAVAVLLAVICPAEGAGEDFKTLTPAFRTFILAGWSPEDMGCDEVVGTQDYWTIGLTRGGLVFAPSLPHVIQSCGEEFTTSFERLRPYLTPAGRENLRALRAEGPVAARR